MSSASTKLLARSKRKIVRFGVRVVSGPDVGLEGDSVSGELTIGSAPGNAITLSDQTVSRHHCRVRGSNHGLALEDLGSTNGTFVEAIEIANATIPDQTRFRVGATLLDVRIVGEESEELSSKTAFGSILGQSSAMRSLFAILPRVANVDAAVLIEGETGTGKTALAEAIHEAGPRAAKPFVVLDCASIPPTLIEGELFGSVAGAYTGAEDRPGLFENADGGTIFLDEIGELAIELQPKLLRVIENSVVRRLGDSQTRSIDTRVIAATNRPLEKLVNVGQFRADLFYRLNTIRIVVPPLRDRPDDVSLLVRHFYREYADASAPIDEDELVDQLVGGDWPGNVRQLRSAVEQALIFGSPTAASGSTPSRVSFREAKKSAVGRWECGFLANLMNKHEGNITRAAREVLMDRTYLRGLLRKHGLYDA